MISMNSRIDQEKEELMAIIYTMRRMEDLYLPDDYLRLMDDDDDDSSSKFMPIDKHWRSQMVEWCYTVSDHFDMNRDTVAIAMNNFDRFMSILLLCEDEENEEVVGNMNTSINDLNGVVFYQLSVMVCLYTAAKIHEAVAIEPKIISLMSRGVYTEQQVVDTELTILRTIQWRLNPPTPMSFVHNFLSMIPIEIIGDPETEEYKMILELTKQQIELAIKDYSFVCSYASSTALAALTNAIQAIKASTAITTTSTDDDSSSSLKFKLQKTISSIITDNNMCPEDFVQYQDRCWDLVKGLPPNQQVNHSSISSLSILKTANGATASDSISRIYESPRGVFF